jgi:hypothetical protein
MRSSAGDVLALERILRGGIRLLMEAAAVSVKRKSSSWVRETRPGVYLKVVASILPKQLEIERDPFDGVTDDQLAALIAAARTLWASKKKSKARYRLQLFGVQEWLESNGKLERLVLRAGWSEEISLTRKRSR